MQYKTENPEHTIYGIFDGVKYPMLWSDLEDGILTYDMLFREEVLRLEMERVAPFFVALDFTKDTDIEQTKELLKCYGENGSLFLATSLNFENTLERMRELFYVYNSKSEVGYFRFYWSTVFTEFVKQTHKNVLFNLFYDIHQYWCENAMEIDTISSYQYKNNQIQIIDKRLKNEI